MADVSTSLCGLRLRSPFLLASGPLSHSGEAIVRAHRAGAGAVVTKTIREEAARNPVPHIAKLKHGLLNGEKWSDRPRRYWIDEGIPVAVEGGAVVIASVAAAPRDLARHAKDLVRAGAAALEVCSYDALDMVPMVQAAVRAVDVPVLAKVSANWPDVREIAAACVAAGGSGITAIDSIGPALRFDIVRREPLLASGHGWLTGGAIFPVALAVVADVAMATGRPIVGTGGVESADDGVEMLMAGAHAMGICSRAMVAGLGVFADLARELSRRLDDLRIPAVRDAIGAGLPALARCLREPILAPAEGGAAVACDLFVWVADRCTDCGLCITACAYEARRTPHEIDGDRCRLCGLCASICPSGALTMRPVSSGWASGGS